MVIYPIIQLAIVFLYTKYELSILYSGGDIFDEKCREKEEWINIGKNKQENASSQSHNTTCPCLPVYQIQTFYPKWFWRYLWRKSVTELRKDGRMEGWTEGRTDINQYTPTFSKRGYIYQSGGIITWVVSLRKPEVSVERISICDVTENLVEHGIYCLSCSYTNDGINMIP